MIRSTVTDEILNALGGDRFPKCESASLRLEKFVRIGGDSKSEEVNAVVGVHNKHGKAPLQWAPPDATTVIAKLGGRLIINQADGILENAGLCLHRHFGYPYIPGSAVKGIARHAAWCEWREAEEPQKQEIANKIVMIFGYPTNDDGLDKYIEPDKNRRKAVAGSVAFMAAVPMGKAQLVADIVNCHHGGYYAGKKIVATDDESTNPQPFPAVEANSEWRFNLLPLLNIGNDAVKQAREWLIKGITLHGIGAKTAAGYGWFIYDPEYESARLASEKTAEELDELRSEFEQWFERVIAELNETEPEKLALKISEVEKERKRFSQSFLKYKTSMPNEQRITDAINASQKRLPQLSPEDELRRKWSRMGVKGVINSELKRFEKLDENQKAQNVVVLRDGTGIGNEVWNELKKLGKKGPLANVVQAIQGYSRNVLKLGKMP